MLAAATHHSWLEMLINTGHMAINQYHSDPNYTDRLYMTIEQKNINKFWVAWFALPKYNDRLYINIEYKQWYYV